MRCTPHFSRFIKISRLGYKSYFRSPILLIKRGNQKIDVLNSIVMKKIFARLFVSAALLLMSEGLRSQTMKICVFDIDLMV